jgi:predicted O-methyltransferase YrrM
MNGLKQIGGFIKHQWQAHTRYSIHSPFVYHFVTQVLPHRRSEAGQRIEKLRKELARHQEIVKLEDFGAGYGGRQKVEIQKTMAQIVRSSARGRREGELLYRIAQAYRPARMLELGTNLGFSSLYLQMGHPDGQLTTLEGAESLATLARENHARMGSAAEIIHTQFDDWFESTADDPTTFDLVFLDGNHRKEPTLAYIRELLPRMEEGGMIILDDIRWSEEMEAAWNELVEWPELNVCLDLYFLGIVFFHRPQAREHFRLRFRPI